MEGPISTEAVSSLSSLNGPKKRRAKVLHLGLRASTQHQKPFYHLTLNRWGVNTESYGLLPGCSVTRHSTVEGSMSPSTIRVQKPSPGLLLKALGVECLSGYRAIES